MGGTVFFDYDGTLHDSMRLYGPAFRHVYAALVAEGWAEPRAFSDEERGRGMLVPRGDNHAEIAA